MTIVLVILSCICLYSVVRIIQRIFVRQKCPSEQVLKSVILFRKDMTSPSSRDIIAHVGQCDHCKHIVDEWNKKR